MEMHLFRHIKDVTKAPNFLGKVLTVTSILSITFSNSYLTLLCLEGDMPFLLSWTFADASSTALLTRVPSSLSS